MNFDQNNISESTKRLMEYKEIQKQKEIIEDKKIQEFLLKK